MGCRGISSLLNWPGLGRFTTDRTLEIGDDDDGGGDGPIVSPFLEIRECLVSPLSGFREALI